MKAGGDPRTTFMSLLLFAVVTGLLELTPSPWPAVLVVPAIALFLVVYGDLGRASRPPHKAELYPLGAIRPRLAWVLAFTGAAMAVVFGSLTIVAVTMSDVLKPPTRLLRTDPVHMVVTAVLWAPIVEEFIFRGWLLHRLLRKVGVGPAIAATSLIFGLVHLDPIGLAGRVLFGVTLAVVVLITGSLWASIL